MSLTDEQVQKIVDGIAAIDVGGKIVVMTGPEDPDSEWYTAENAQHLSDLVQGMGAIGLVILDGTVTIDTLTREDLETLLATRP